MIKEAIEYIVGLSKPEIEEIGTEVYSDKKLYRISYTPYAEPIKLTTLSSLVEYIKGYIDALPSEMIIHVESPTRVKMYSALDADRQREYIAEVNALVPEFAFGKFMNHENFLIAMQSKFISDPKTDKALLLKFAGTVESGTVAQYGDDGVSQKATVKTGIASKGEALVPSPVRLKPYRTFIEVDQPVSEFVFRMKEDKYEGVQCAIFEADGGAWRNAAMDAVKKYLKSKLIDTNGFTIIS